MAAGTERGGHRDPSPEEKLLRAMFGERVSEAGSENDAQHLARDQALFGALDAISDSFEANVGRWNSELDLIEETLSRSSAVGRYAEATQ